MHGDLNDFRVAPSKGLDWALHLITTALPKTRCCCKITTASGCRTKTCYEFPFMSKRRDGKLPRVII